MIPIEIEERLVWLEARVELLSKRVSELEANLLFVKKVADTSLSTILEEIVNHSNKIKGV